jgi:hypothetical protein
MNIQANIIKLIVNPIFYMLWRAVYTLAVLFLFIARIHLTIKDWFVISAKPQSVNGLAVSQNLMGTPVP